MPAPARLRVFSLTFLSLLFLAGVAAGLKWVSAQTPQGAAAVPDDPFPNKMSAPALDGGTDWLNTTGPISLRDVKGKVVLLDFWTYCCINCIHVLPDLKFLEEKYPNQLVVIGVHADKFTNERDTENIRQAILRYEISHPVVNDAQEVIRDRYAFSSWPTLILIDPEGNLIGKASGEGNREVLDGAIAKLIEYHRAKGTLDETPVMFNLERQKQPATPLRYPGKIVTDPAGGRIFVSDSNHNRIVVASPGGELLATIGTGEIGAKDGNYENATFNHPQGMALQGEKLYVADTENHLLRVVDLAAKTVLTLAGTGEQAEYRTRGGPLRLSALNSPWDLQILDGNLYIAMAGPHQLWKHKLGSPTLEVFAGSGREDILDGNLTGSALAQPSGITTDGKLLYHVDSEGSAVRAVDPQAGTVVTLVGPRDLARGRSLFEFGDIDGVGDQARLQHPLGVLHDRGKLFVADTYNHKIKVVDPKDSSSETWLGDGHRGTDLSPVRLSEPAGLALLGKELLIADTNNHRILGIDLDTKKAREFVIRGLQPPAPVKPVTEVPFRGQVAEVPPASLLAGKPAKFTLKFDLPPGFKLNELAPLSYEWKSEGGTLLADAGLAGKRQRLEVQGATIPLELPLATGEASGTLTLTIAYQYCRDGIGGVCRAAEQRWTIPVKLTSNGSSSLELTAKPGF